MVNSASLGCLVCPSVLLPGRVTDWPLCPLLFIAQVLLMGHFTLASEAPITGSVGRHTLVKNRIEQESTTPPQLPCLEQGLARGSAEREL